MAQELEQIVEVLREMNRANSNNSENFDRLLANINNKIDMIDKNVATADLIKAYMTDLAKATDEKYTTTIDRFSNIEQALKAIFNGQDEHVKNKDIKELFDIFSNNLNNFYSEARQQKALISSIESRLAEISNDKSDKEDILRTITLLRNDFENINHGYKSTIDSINTDLKSIISSIIKADQTSINNQIKDQVDVMYKALSDIVNYLTSIDKRDTNLELLLSNVATNENLKITQSVVDSIIEKAEEISERMGTLADKSDVEGLQVAASYMNKKIDETATKQIITELAEKSDSLADLTNEIKQTLAKVSKDIDAIPDTTALEDSLQALFKKLNGISKDIDKINVKKDVSSLDTKITNLTGDLFTIKNIITDLNEVVTLKVLTAINDLSFEQECSDIKDHVSKILATLPQKEDIEKLLERNVSNQNAVEDLIKKADIIADKIDTLPTHDDIEALNNNQLGLVENLQGVANKEDIENILSKSDEIENLIDNLNFDEEFENLYDKTASIEKWLIDSKVKENTEEIISKIDKKATQEDVLTILKTVDNIVNEIDDLSKNVDAKKVNRTVADVYQMIEELKNDFINTTEMHNDSIIVNLSELQKSIENIVTGDEFDNFVEDLKAFVVSSVSNNEENKTKLIEIKEIQDRILTKLEYINIPSIDNLSGIHAGTIDEKLNTISDYLTNINQPNTEEIKKTIYEIKETLENKKSNFKDLEKNQDSELVKIENYLNDIKSVLNDSDTELSKDIELKLNEIEACLNNCNSSNESAINTIISKLDEYLNKISDTNLSQADFSSSANEIIEIKNNIAELSESFNSLNLEDSAQYNTSAFVSEILNELATNLEELSCGIDEKLQHGFAYNAELIEEKTATILNFIQDLKQSNCNNSTLYDQLSCASTKLGDYKQELEFVNTDVINTLNGQTEELLRELEPIKNMLSSLTTPMDSNKEKLKENLSEFHDSLFETLSECSKYSQSTYDKLEDSYEKITRELTDTENNLKDFILSDIDSVIIKIDTLRNDIEDSLNRISPPDAKHMEEFRQFVEQIAKFNGDPTELVEKAAEDIVVNINETLYQQHEELKSMIAVAVNNQEILSAIEDLKISFSKKLENLNSPANIINTEDKNDFVYDDFSTNEYESVFENSSNTAIIEELKTDFDKFALIIESLTEDNSEIKDVLEIIKSKINSITTPKSNLDSDNLEDFDDSDFDEHFEDETQIINENEFDFIKAFDLLKQDIENIHNRVEQILSKEEQEKASLLLASNENNELLSKLVEKFESLSDSIKPQEWFEEIKTYIAGEQIHSILEEINEKIDVLTLTDNSEFVDEIKTVIAQISSENNVITDPQIQSMLDLINEKIDILAANDDYELIEEVKEAIERIDSNITNNNDTEKLLNAINSKIDIIASTDNFDNFDEKITTILDDLNQKFDTITIDSQKEFEDIRNLFKAQAQQIENIENYSKSEAVKKCLEDIITKVNDIDSNNSDSVVNQSIKEMKESIIGAIVSVFEQVSFIEEAEDIKDFVEEKTDEINQNLATVTNKLRQITNADDDSDYVYSMQDIESDLAKLRLALNKIQENEEENQAQHLASILQNINTIGASVEDLQSSITKDSELKDKFERVTSEINELSILTNRLFVASGESYNTLTSNFEDFGRIITDNLTTKVDNVTRLLETSHASDKVMRQALIYMGEWIDSASESMNKISTNAEEIVDIKSSIESLKNTIPEQTDILNSIEEKFDEQQERLAYFEKQIAKLGGLEDKFEAQQERIDRLEMALEKILSAVEDIDDSKVTRKIDKIDKQIAKLSTNIEKIASYVD